MNDVLANVNKLDFVRSQLSSYAGEKKSASGRMMILCPFHSERTPSGSISLNDRFPGYFKCFGCGKQVGWNDLAERLNLQPFGKSEVKEEYAFDLQVERQRKGRVSEDGYVEDEFKFSELPKNKLWRTISTNLLRELEGQLCYRWFEDYQKWGTEKFIHLPVMINGTKRGYFLARLKKSKDKDKPSYLLAKAATDQGWSRKYGLWPFDRCVQMGKKAVVLVEGQRDALRLLAFGIPAMCIFGTQSWSETKATLLEVAGFETIIVMMDGDCAGLKAIEMIRPSIRAFFTLKVVNLAKIKGSPYLQFKDKPNPTKAAKAAGVELWDPANCPEWILKRLKRKYFS
jgi:hypothetical protein